MGPLLEGARLELTHGETSSRWGMDQSPWAMRSFNSASRKLSLACSNPTCSTGREGVRARWIALLSSLKRVDSRHSAVVFFREGEGEDDWYSCYHPRKYFDMIAKTFLYC